MLRSVESWLAVAHKSVFRYSQRWQRPSIRPRYLNSLYSEPVPEHDVVPEGSVDIQVYLFDLCWEGTSLELHFLEEKDKETSWKSPKTSLTYIKDEITSHHLTSYFPLLSCLTFSMSSSKAQACPRSCRGMPLYTRFANWTHTRERTTKTHTI